MNILINTSNITKGGGLQVADSFCRQLNRFPRHRFIVVLSPPLGNLQSLLRPLPNILDCVVYAFPPRDVKSFITGRNEILDGLVEKYAVQTVVSVFGPVTWKPKCFHFCGFAIAHLVMPESPYWKTLTWKERLKSFLFIQVNKWRFRRGTSYLYTENEMISQRVRRLIKGSTVVTISNTYNQVFNSPERWTIRELPPFDGLTFLTVSSAYPHKNLEIAIRIAELIKEKEPDLGFRFVFTIDASEYPELGDGLKDHFCFVGKVDIDEVPSLYNQCDIVFQPTLLECFTATYAEAMKMRKPIITTDLAFARGLCSDAALYYSAVSPEDATEKLLELSHSEQLYKHLVERGCIRVESFNTPERRADQIIRFCEDHFGEDSRDL